jgi:hypothetical protein
MVKKMIILKDETITEDIKKNHKNWFLKYFKKRVRENKEFYNKLEEKEKKWFNELLGLDTETEYEGILNADKKIEYFIVREDIEDIIKSYDDDYNTFNKIEEKEKIINEIEETAKIIREKIKEEEKTEEKEKLYDEFFRIIEKYESEIINYREIKEEVDKNRTEQKKLYDMRKKIIIKTEKLEKFIKSIFNYDKFSDNHRHKIISSMKIEVCPYCQRHHTTNYREENMEKTTADLDHFYIKSRYPYLAFSLYNFIPSCNICNSRTKGSFDFHKNKGIYPHKEEFGDDAKFKTSANTINTILDNSAEFEVKIDVNENAKLKDKIKNSIKAFKLNEVYATSHNDYIKDMLNNLEKYPEEYIDVIGDIFYDEDKEKEQKKELVKYMKEMIKKPYLDRIEKGEPLAKLTKDIMEEFKKIENK